MKVERYFILFRGISYQLVNKKISFDHELLEGNIGVRFWSSIPLRRFKITLMVVYDSSIIIYEKRIKSSRKMGDRVLVQTPVDLNNFRPEIFLHSFKK